MLDLLINKMAKYKARKKKKSIGKENFIGLINKVILGTPSLKPKKTQALANLYRVISHAGSNKYKYVIEDIYRVPGAVNLIENYNFEKLVFPDFISMDVNAELLLFEKLISSKHELLVDFISNTTKFEELYIYGRYEEAELQLNYINSEFGLTLWEIENRINLLILCKGADICREYVSALKRNIIDGLAIVIIDHFFDRANSKDARLFINKHIAGTFRELRESGHRYVIDFISTNSIPFEYDDPRDFSLIISAGKKLNILDRYLYIRKVFIFLSTRNQQHQELGISKGLLESFYSNMQMIIPTENWGNYSEDNILKSYDDSGLGPSILKEYTAGDYDLAIELFFKLIESEPLNLCYSEMFIKSNVYLEQELVFPEGWSKSSIVKEFLINLYHVCTISEQITESEDRIEQIVIKNSSLSFVASVKAVYSSIYPHLDKERLITSLKELNNSSIKGTPKLTNLLESNGENTADFFKSTMMLLSIGDYDESNIPKERVERYEVRKDIICSTSKNDDLENRIDKLFSYGSKFCNPDYLNLKFEYLFNSKQFTRAAKFVAETCVQNINYFRCYPLHDLIEKLVASSDLDYREPSLVVVFYIYSKMISIGYDDYLCDFYEEYIESNDVEKPSEILESKDILSQVEEYLFKFICIPSIMDVSTKFKSSDELKSERITIIESLQSRFNIDESFLSKEKVEIINEIIVQKSARGIESSKIFVDVQELKNKRREEYESLYRLFIDSSGEDDEYIQLEDMSKDADSTSYLYKGGRNSVLQRTIANMRQDFVFSNDYGIDRYLSSEIRHGIFVNQLRSGIESYLHVTEKDAGNKYLPNLYWTDHYDYLPNEFKVTLEKSLSKFTKRFDECINKANEWFKVTKDNSDKNNLFRYIIEVDDFDQLKSVASAAPNFEDFFDSLIAFMWALTERSLINVKKHINEELKEDLLSIFDKLRLELEPITSSFQLNKLFGEIQKAQNNVLEDIITITGWFKRDESSRLTELSMEQCIEVAIESFRTICRPRELSIGFNSARKQQSGVVLPRGVKCLVLSLMTAFTNSLKYGVFYDESHFEVELNSDNNEHCLTISNKVKEEYFDKLNNGGLDDIVHKMNTTDARNSMVVEGGAGLGKIKYLLHEAFENPVVEINLIGDVFELKFFIKLEG